MEWEETSIILQCVIDGDDPFHCPNQIHKNMNTQIQSIQIKQQQKYPTTIY
jgi:hypothetical protein